MTASATRTALRYALATGLAILLFDLAADILGPRVGVFGILHAALALMTLPLLFFVLRRDLLARERAEAAQRSVERRLAHLLNAASHAVIAVGQDHRILHVNRGAGALFGYQPAELVGQPLAWLLPAAPTLEQTSQPLAPDGGRAPQSELLARRKDGSDFPAEISYSRLVQDGELTYTLILTDVTRRKDAESVLQQERDRFASILAAMNDGVMIVSHHGAIEYCNPVMQAEVESLSVAERAEAWDAGLLVSPLTRNEEPDGERLVRWEWLSPCTGRTYSVCDTPLVNADGSASKLKVFHDVTLQQRMEAQLRASEEQFRQLAEHIQEAFWIAAPDFSQVLYISPTYETLWGRSCASLYADPSTLVSAVLDSDRPRLLSALATRREFDEECRIVRPDGVVRWVRLRGFPIRHEMGAVYRIAGIAEDITERVEAYHLLEARVEQRTRELYIQAQHLAALEERQRLARELHDSLSQALYGIALGAHTAITYLDSNRDKVANALDYVLGLAEGALIEMRALILELRPEYLEKEGLVGALTRQVAAVRARHGLPVTADLCGEPDAGLELKETLYRIAQEALHNTVRHAQATQVDLRLVCDAGALRLEICDDGVGFNPAGDFPGHLGLRSMRERAARLGGTLSIQSTPGSGTCICIRIPHTGGCRPALLPAESSAPLD
jgi:PAS domain S-box-containing protein